MRFWEHQEEARRETRKLLLAFALAVVVLVVAVHLALTLAWLLLFSRFDFPRGFLLVNVGVSLLLVLGGWWIETDNLRKGGAALARRAGAREARPSISHAEQRLVNVVEELSIAANGFRPQVMVLPRAEMINAFAAGWEPGDSVVAVTQGALDHLTREELQGMVAHELSHLYEGDTRLKMQLAGMVFGLELVHQFGESLRERGGLAWWFGNAVMAAGFAGWITGRMLKAGVSRQREHLADARAVQWTRSRDGLGGVLRKVMTQQEEHGSERVRGLGHSSVQHMLLVELPDEGRVAHWLDSHPPLTERVRRTYRRPMSPLPLAPVNEPPERARRR
ncbi:Protease HtpX [bioreactor metagenome]|uniref:Protease HtpX n=1 Tax=bioreactor metagenome TaxID=1076179 RepID=A0A644ZZ43_9ZZZZ